MAMFSRPRSAAPAEADAVQSSPDGPFEERFAALLDAGDDGIARAVDAALAEAVARGASDLHFEPWMDALALRFRIDGMLHDRAMLPKAAQARIVSRLKVLARIVVYERQLPQDGRIEAAATPAGRPMRVSTFPTVYGEKAVVRIFEADHGSLPLDGLGFQSGTERRLRALLTTPHGTLLLTGPSSSGKTTTIYALLREMLGDAAPRRHIVTIEDPVECRLDRVAQSEVNPAAGFTFQEALRALLRQDPEVVMVGEIRDAETARIAVQAGLTGHLVISTIHSGTAAGVFTRLLDMGVEPFLIGSSVTGVLAQRLVRRLCPSCAAPAEPAPTHRARFGSGLDGRVFRSAVGCAACVGIGYRGRTAIAELLQVDDALVTLLLERVRTAELHAAAVDNGMRPIEDDGLARAAEGVTTLDELMRVLPVVTSHRRETP